MTTPELLDPNDFAKFKSKDESWFLGAVGDGIRDYCGWHIAPVISDTNVQARIGAEGIVMLPTLNIVSVEQVVLDGITLTENTDYTVHSAGYLVLAGHSLCGTGVYARLRGSQRAIRPITVDMTHGFTDIPRPVSEVGFEVASRTMEKPAGVVTDLTSGPYRFKFGEFGSVLSDEQRSRLGPYCIEQVW